MNEPGRLGGDNRQLDAVAGQLSPAEHDALADRAAVLLMLALPGGAYIYQGEELGLPEVLDLPDDLRQDPTFLRTGGASLGRDGCRVPMPWSGGRPTFGFGPGARSWLPHPPEWAMLTVERQAADPHSMLSLYRDTLHLRHQLQLDDGPIDWIDAAPDLIAFRRTENFACVVNVGDVALPFPAGLEGDVVKASGALAQRGAIPMSTAVWLTTKRTSRRLRRG